MKPTLHPLPRPILFVLLLTALAHLPGCGGTPDPSIDPVVRDSAGVVIHEFPAAVLERPAPIRLADAPGVRIGVIEGAAEYQWTRPVAAARLSDGGFAVVEQVPAEVRVFDRSGRFVRRVGGEGGGPGEFRSPAGIAALPGDTLLVWDPGARRLTWFSPDGAVARERTLREPGGIVRARRVALSPGGEVTVLGPTSSEEELANQGRVRETWQVVPVGPRGDAGAPVGAVPGTERSIEVQRSGAGEVTSITVQGRWWWGDGFAWGSRRGVWTADQLALEARHFDPERGLDRVVRVLADDRPFTPALIDSLHQVELDRVDDPSILAAWRADLQGREYPPGVPPVGSVFADAAGRVWIGLMAPPPERLPSGGLSAVGRWLVFEDDPGAEAGEPSLRLLGTLTLPPRSHPVWADGEGVLLVRNDAETDVAYVEWYRYVEE